MRQGQSRNTKDKEVRFSGLFRRNIVAVNGIASKGWFDGYVHFDLNSGSGWNDEQGVNGSPVVFMNAIQLADFPWVAFFVEQDKERITKLMRLLGHRHNVFYIHGDNAAFAEIIPGIVDRFLEWDPKRSFGSVVSDPNGTQHPFECLGTIAESLPRIDHIVSLGANHYKRAAGAFGPRFANPITKLMGHVRKRKWQIATPLGNDQWTVLFGSNYSGWKEHPSAGIHDIESPTGKMAMKMVQNIGAKWESPMQTTMSFSITR